MVAHGAAGVLNIAADAAAPNGLTMSPDCTCTVVATGLILASAWAVWANGTAAWMCAFEGDGKATVRHGATAVALLGVFGSLWFLVGTWPLGFLSAGAATWAVWQVRHWWSAWLAGSLVATAASMLAWLFAAATLGWPAAVATAAGGGVGVGVIAGWWQFERGRLRRARQPGLRRGVLLAGRYRVGRALGEGAQGTVRRAWDKQQRRHVVIKHSHASLDGEIDVLRRIDHPNVIRVLDDIVTPRGACVVLEYAPGGTVAAPVDGATWRRWFLDALAGLGAVHDAGVIHRDLKPDNLLLDAAGRVRVADFGLAADVDVDVTQVADGVQGTVSYMSPEQARGRSVGVTGDLYSVASIFYELLRGERLAKKRPGESGRSLQGRVAAGIAPDTAGWPADLANFFCDALHVEPGRRPPTAEAMARLVQGLRLPEQ